MRCLHPWRALSRVQALAGLPHPFPASGILPAGGGPRGLAPEPHCAKSRKRETITVKRGCLYPWRNTFRGYSHRLDYSHPFPASGILASRRRSRGLVPEPQCARSRKRETITEARAPVPVESTRGYSHRLDCRIRFRLRASLTSRRRSSGTGSRAPVRPCRESVKRSS